LPVFAQRLQEQVEVGQILSRSIAAIVERPKGGSRRGRAPESCAGAGQRDIARAVRLMAQRRQSGAEIEDDVALPQAADDQPAARRSANTGSR
jgi:hypothetical protein